MTISISLPPGQGNTSRESGARRERKVEKRRRSSKYAELQTGGRFDRLLKKSRAPSTTAPYSLIQTRLRDAGLLNATSDGVFTQARVVRVPRRDRIADPDSIHPEEVGARAHRGGEGGTEAGGIAGGNDRAGGI